MSIISTIVKSETPRDVILFLAGGENGISYPRLDGLYNRNGWANISNNIELLKLVDTMTTEGLINHVNGALRKGPMWRSPEFMVKKKYTFE
ncbi:MULTISPECIES: hypothetical protein [Pseudomonas]|uniref:hypothetical protein n=1 Tax=Pseudomonas TaxID=286 RepID=UPI000B35800F|nr:MULTISPECIES: hypothetical protein [Pseudomonas]PMY59843.1 hypothetical protein C1Y31_30025 [Pseudomonas sp. FW305-25]PMY61360.1 hypothetical protein C1Y32_29930 [Pseudomonas sp. FW126-L8]PNA71604.1 hypothetical protein C1Y33_29050 [Pseudomonas sp. FW305-76]